MDLSTFKTLFEYFGLPFAMFVVIIVAGVKCVWVFGYQYRDAMDRAHIAETRAVESETNLNRERALNGEHFEMMVGALERSVAVSKQAVGRLEGGRQ
jgi:hypothetical protein